MTALGKGSEISIDVDKMVESDCHGLFVQTKGGWSRLPILPLSVGCHSMLEKDNYGHFWFVRDKTLYRELGLNRDELFEGSIRGTIYQEDGQSVVSNAVLQLMIEDNLIAMGKSDSTGMFQLTLLSNFPIENYNFNVNTDSLTYKYQNKIEHLQKNTSDSLNISKEDPHHLSLICSSTAIGSIMKAFAVLSKSEI